MGGKITARKVLALPPPVLPAGRRRPAGSGRAVVAVGDVEPGQGVEGAAEGGDGGGAAMAQVADGVRRRGGDVGRRTPGGLGKEPVDGGAIGISQEDRAGLGVEGFDLADPVVFLVRAA